MFQVIRTPNQACKLDAREREHDGSKPVSQGRLQALFIIAEMKVLPAERRRDVHGDHKWDTKTGVLSSFATQGQYGMPLLVVLMSQ